ncbi:MAG: GNAT family N-acetyltransferase [Candidatus Roizmanbacteria bacterium]|nr:GNAT family N-acetyltransferase [Candidatus Roizmanbacteria bacterium]
MTVDDSAQVLLPNPNRLLVPEHKLPLSLTDFHVIDHQQPDMHQIRGVTRLLTHPSSVHRFANPPESDEDMVRIATTDKIQVVTATHPTTGEVIAAASITDGKGSEHEHWLGYFVTDDELRRMGVGEQLMAMAQSRAFMTRAYDGRFRERLYIGVTLNEGHAAMLALAQKMGFNYTWELGGGMGEQAHYEDLADLIVNWQPEMKRRFATQRRMITAKEWALNTVTGFYPDLERWGIADTLKDKLAARGWNLGTGNGNGH